MTNLQTHLENIIRQAGAMAMEMRPHLEVQRKDDGTVVTQADVAVENLLRKRLLELLPESDFLGEEIKAEINGIEGYTWVVDPIDGTDAFRHGLAYFGVSVGLAHDGEIVLAAFYNPMLNELYVARKGEGAYCNGRRMQILHGIALNEESFALGPSDFHIHYHFSLPIKVRSLGSIAQHFALVADGRACCALCRPHLWDIAAGLLLVEEAGGIVRFLDGRSFSARDYLHGELIPSPLLASPPDIWEKIAENINWRL